MSEVPIAVLDASVGSKWIKEEDESDAARGILRAHQELSLRIVVPDLFFYEVAAVAVREGGAAGGAAAWGLLRAAELTAVPLGDALAAAAFAQCAALGCTFYDALAPAVATIHGATLYSADRKAHEAYRGVVLL